MSMRNSFLAMSQNFTSSLPKTQKQQQQQHPTSSINEPMCYFCHKPKSSSTLKFSKCDHFICTPCLYQHLFRYHLLDIKNDIDINVKCLCGKGILSRTLDNILSMFSDKVELDDIQCTEENEATRICAVHSGNGHYTKYFCIQCRLYLCHECIKRDSAVHGTHRIVECTAYMKKLKRAVETIPTMYSNKELFSATLDSAVNVIKEVVQCNLYNKLKVIDNIMENVALLRKEYEDAFKRSIKHETKKLKILKLFYLNYFYEKEKVEKSTDLRLLSFINDIDVDFMGIKRSDTSEYDKKLLAIQQSVDTLRQSLHLKLIEYDFNKIPRGYVQDCLISNVHESQGFPCLLELNDGRLVTASQDLKIRVWTEKENEDKTGFEYVNTCISPPNAGSVICLLLLDNGDIVTSSKSDNAIKIWAIRHNVDLIATLTKHTKPVRAMANLNKSSFISGSSDLTMIVWSKPRNRDNFDAVQVIQGLPGTVTFLLGIRNQRFVCAVDYGEVHVYGKRGIDIEFDTPNDSVNAVVTDNGNKYERKQVIEKYIPLSKASTVTSKKDKPSPVLFICEAHGGRFLLTAGQFGTVVYRLNFDNDVNEWKYEKMQIICEEKCNINAVIELKDKHIAYSAQNRTVRIFKLVDKDGTAYQPATPDDVLHYEHGLHTLIQLQDGRLAACSTDKKIVLWRNRTYI